ncbi:Esterase FUS5 [Lachnellula suecica]|uniref:Esterase FUS5 n=1 Tax=Lachnellula suecica TaxID=602035 RepID=A0A8T9C9D6_9HELO|nr:Esterase FUS5 [Lachnellula suecica]
MRFLCLHGMGTNSEIFETQSAAIRYGLGDEHTYEFLEATITAPMAPGIETLVSPNTECFTWTDDSSRESYVTSYKKALMDLDEFLAEYGPFDAVMAFSNGAALAASLIIQKLQNCPQEQDASPVFKCAVFFSGGIPVLVQGESFQLIDRDTSSELIHIPTANIWGAKDSLYPDFGPVVKTICRADLAESYIHQGGHEIPGSKDEQAVASSVKLIKRTIERARNAEWKTRSSS